MLLWVYVVFIAAIVVAGVYRKLRRFVGDHDSSAELQSLATSIHVREWAKQHGLRYFNIGNQLRQAARMEANREKDFFRADLAMTMEDDGPYVEGAVHGRNVWLYVSVGRPRPGSLHTITRDREVEVPTLSRAGMLSSFLNGSSGMQTVRQAQQVLYAWCLEIGTNPIPHHLRITRQGLQEADELDTESRAFEDRYDVNNFDDSLSLQLLDPHMIQLVEESRADAIEFSDSSVVIYELSQHTTTAVLEALLAAGLRIAEQVDRNYPLSKYAKHGD